MGLGSSLKHENSCGKMVAQRLSKDCMADQTVLPDCLQPVSPDLGTTFCGLDSDLIIIWPPYSHLPSWLPSVSSPWTTQLLWRPQFPPPSLLPLHLPLSQQVATNNCQRSLVQAGKKWAFPLPIVFSFWVKYPKEFEVSPSPPGSFLPCAWFWGRTVQSQLNHQVAL